jgi:recombinational DNA repair protein (RecF pathway)
MQSLSQTLRLLENGASPAETILHFELDTIRRLGHLPSWQWCVACGEAIENDRSTIAFSTAGGGVVCPLCTYTQKLTLRMQQKTLEILIQSSLGDDLVREPTPLPPSLPTIVRSELRLVIESILQYHADRRLKMLEYLEDLKR